MENLDHVEGDERHHDALFVRRAGKHVGDVDIAHVKVDAHKEAREHERRDDEALHDAVDTHVAGKHAVAGVARTAAHHVALGVLEPERERGEAVGHEVHPQQLYRLEDGEADQRGDKDAEDLGQVGGEQELNHLADVVVDATTLFAGMDDGGEIVVGQDHVGHVLGDVGTGDAHADADIGALDGGRVVHAVARHGHNLVAALPGLHDARLVLGLHARVHAELADALVELLVAHAVELGTRDGLLAALHNAQLARDGHGRIDVVTRDHDGADAGVVRLGDGHGGLGAHRVNHARKAAEHQVVLQSRRAAVGRHLRVAAARQRQHAQGLVGHRLVGGGDLRAALVGQRHHGIVLKDMGAQPQHHVGRALGVLLKAAVQGLHHNGHHLAARIERGLAHARVLLVKAGQARLGGIVYQSALGGLAHGFAGLGVPLGV